MNTPTNTQNSPLNTPANTPSDTPDNTPANDLEAVLDRIGELVAQDQLVHVALWRGNPSGGWDTVKTKLPAAEFDPDILEPGRWRVRLKVGERMTLDKQATFTRSAIVVATPPAALEQAAAPVALQAAAAPQYTRGTAGGFDPLQFVIDEMRAAREQNARLMERLTQPAPASNSTETIQLIGALKPLLAPNDKSTDAKTMLEIGEKLADRFAGGDAPAPIVRNESGISALAKAFAPALAEIAKAIAPALAASMVGGAGGGASGAGASVRKEAQPKRSVPNTAAAPEPAPELAPEQANDAQGEVISQSPSEAITPAAVVVGWLDALAQRKPKTIARAGSLLVAIYDATDNAPPLEEIESYIMANLAELANACAARGIETQYALEVLQETAAIMQEPDDAPDDAPQETTQPAAAPAPEPTPAPAIIETTPAPAAKAKATKKASKA